MKNPMYQTAYECQQYAKNSIILRRNKIPYQRAGLLFTDYDILGDIKQYEALLLKLCDSIKEKYPFIEVSLKKHIDNYNNDRIIHFSAIQAIVDCIVSLEKMTNEIKKIFISHSSKDVGIIEKFIDHILGLGIGINANDIFCSSIEGMDIKNGEDLRRHIQNNIRTADFSYLMISEHYKQSEICLNEMGAVWAYDSNVRVYMLPNADVDKIGWLCNVRKGDFLHNSIVLDEIKHELCEYYHLPDTGTTWSRQRELFCSYLNQLQGE